MYVNRNDDKKVFSRLKPNPKESEKCVSSYSPDTHGKIKIIAKI